jgi:hypothetical protein
MKKHEHIYRQQGKWIDMVYKNGDHFMFGPTVWVCECGKEKKELEEGDLEE